MSAESYHPSTPENDKNIYTSTQELVAAFNNTTSEVIATIDPQQRRPFKSLDEERLEIRHHEQSDEDEVDITVDTSLHLFAMPDTEPTEENPVLAIEQSLEESRATANDNITRNVLTGAFETRPDGFRRDISINVQIYDSHKPGTDFCITAVDDYVNPDIKRIFIIQNKIGKQTISDDPEAEVSITLTPQGISIHS